MSVDKNGPGNDKVGEPEVNPLSSALLPGNLRRLRNVVSEQVVDEGVRQLARHHGVDDDSRPEHRPPPPPRVRPRSPIAPDIEMPYDGEEISWKSHLRADFPEYVFEQLNEYCHRHRCTLTSALIQMMAAFTSPEGRPYFYVRKEDMVPDRRKVSRKRR